MLWFFVFFFQAEDGIRDYKVTGVQTCALPISFAPAINGLVVLLAEGQGLGQVRDDLDPHLAAAQALILMVGYLSLETVVAASARPLGADEPALRERWREAAVELVVGGVGRR